MRIGTRLARLLGSLSSNLARPRRRGRGLAQRGMTLLEIMIVLAILALVMGLIVGPRVMKMFGESREKLTKLKVDKYANEAFTQWQMNNTGKGCPSGINDLNVYMNDQGKDASNDPWGHPIKMICGSGLPPGASGVAIMSAGPDGQENTADDIKSW